MSYPYPGMPAGPPGIPQPGGAHHHHHPHVPPAGPAAGEVDFVQVKIRYRDRDMMNSYKVHIFAEDRVLGNLHAEVQNLNPRSELKRNQEAHCITVTRMGKCDHFFDIQLFRLLNRRGFKLKTSHSTTLQVDSANDVISTYVLARGG
ncbi:uncharacterized protein [Amphiura filiformis]|uniref:uncharacterized protein n=1 Tax=Amphiura filiformis TaxID=82378 RepID=UPI003B20D810